MTKEAKAEKKINHRFSVLFLVFRVVFPSDAVTEKQKQKTNQILIFF